MRKFYCLLATALCLLTVGAAQAQDVADFANDMAPQIAGKLRDKLSGATPSIGVMPFSNEDGTLDASFAGTMKAMQGELISSLRAEKAGYVLDTRGIKRSFTNASTHPNDLDISDPAATGTVLQALKWDAVVMGQFNSTDPAAVAALRTNELKWSLTIIFQDGTVIQLESTSSKSVIPSPKCADPSGRFNVEILVDGQVQPFLVDPHADSQYHNVKFLQIDPSMVGKEYQIRLTNHGTPQVGYASRSVPDEERIFGAAVLIDGIDSFARETGRVDPSGKPMVDFAQVHPKNAWRWLLANPGQVIRPDSSSPEGFVLAPGAPGNDHSARTIAGYQMGPNTAAAFTFAQSGAGETTAELIGVTEDIGMIEVCFYARQLEGDRMLPSHRDNVAGLGTKPGRDIQNSVVSVQPRFHPAAVEVWRIYYRTAGSMPVPDDSLVPYSPGG